MEWMLIITTSLIAAYLAYRWFLWPRCCQSKAKLSGRTVLITGGSDGIGKATALELAKRGAYVIIACRNHSKSEKVVQEIKEAIGKNNSVKAMELDLSSLASVRKFVTKFKKDESRLDILVNNAGVSLFGQPRSVSQDGIEIHLAVNHMGHFLLTNLLLDNLKASAPSRVINLSSFKHGFGKSMDFMDLNLEKTPYNSDTAYSYSKLANVLFTKELSRRLKGTGVTTYAVHPGIIKTNIMSHHWFMKLPGIDAFFKVVSLLIGHTPYHGAQTTVYCSVAEELESVSGKYYSNCAEKAPAPAAEDREAAQRLWNISEKMTGL